MYKFLSKTWSYFMGVKDCLLLLITIFSILFALGRYMIKNGDMTANDILEIVGGETEEKPVKKTKKQKIHVVKTD